MEGISSKNENNIENISKLEKLKSALKTLSLYGMLALTLNSSTNENTVSNIKQNKIENYDFDEESSTIFDYTNINNGFEGFNYYKPEILVNFETFFSYIKNDNKFKNLSVFKEVKNLHSKERLLALNNKLNLKTISSEFREQITNEINKFKIIEDEEILFEKAMRIKYERIKNHINEINLQKKVLVEKIKSEEYLNKLIKELDGNEEEAIKLQEKRANQLINTEFMFSNDEYLSGYSSKLGKYMHGTFLCNKSNVKNKILIHNEKIKKTDSVLDSSNKYKYKKINNSFYIHEAGHAATKNLIPEKTKEVLISLLDTVNMFSYQKENLKYNTNVDEIITRMMIFNIELENLDIKKYKEEFNEKHYEKINELINNGKVDINAVQFFRMYRKESIIFIINNIA